MKTKLYMDTGDWTNDIEKAHHFETSADAIRFASKRRLKNIEILHSFPTDPKHDFSSGSIDFYLPDYLPSAKNLTESERVFYS